MVTLRRTTSLFFALAMALVASYLAIGFFNVDGLQWLDLARVALLALTTAWLAWGAVLALNGLFSLRRGRVARARGPISARTAVIVPVYNEDPVKSFSHVAAMAGSLGRTSFAARFDFAILSDTNDPRIAAKEEFWLARLKDEVGASCNIYYRRRVSNPGKKAGNVADFIKTSGALYDYLIILDADSLMEGATMVEMVRRMEADPELGLLQTLPKVIRARSFFGRAIQFSASYYSPIFALGVALLQGAEGPFWGHNAITRTRAFAQSCGLPELPGKPPFGGHVLSHDYVEAALLARNGWKVRLDPDLRGSYEEGPDNVVDYAKRDRRWCQGNLQHSRIVPAPGLKGWNRFVFVQGIMAYVSAPLWALFLAASIAAPAMQVIPDYFPVPGLPVFPRVETANALALLTGVVGLLLGPKLLILVDGMMTGRNRRFGGTLRAFLGVVTEIVCTSVLAPVMMLFQTRAVIEILAGADAGWPAANREAGRVSLTEAWAASWWIVVVGLITIGTAYRLAPEYLPFVLLVAAPQVMAPLIISVTSCASGALLRSPLGLFGTIDEISPSPVMREQQSVLSRWRADPVKIPASASGAIEGSESRKSAEIGTGR
ncbi:glucans biosynthesis glucosyltransferase MdoH [Chelativorans sp. AA-79]|uniref:glucans biosynthesis glucosyltransferase MdoH n=1 Tax=Chelativorans sp. AA-79 TaxID=3028735 RepID=UPI0023F6E358|nr:glucans biosynthesis glucosyltransferase MdoH [Chelativorans sp. AA-79]WEX10092.1 glucans biosynthesis glucosyltransferase MdoH [Chelativorans sp. AA-79]